MSDESVRVKREVGPAGILSTPGSHHLWGHVGYRRLSVSGSRGAAESVAEAAPAVCPAPSQSFSTLFGPSGHEASMERPGSLGLLLISRNNIAITYNASPFFIFAAAGA